MQLRYECWRDLEKLPLGCGCVMHPSGLILQICEEHQKQVDPDRVIALMLAANAKIAAAIEKIDAFDRIEANFHMGLKPLGEGRNLELAKSTAEILAGAHRHDKLV